MKIFHFTWGIQSTKISLIWSKNSELLAQGNYGVPSWNFLHCSRNLIQVHPSGLFGLQIGLWTPLHFFCAFVQLPLPPITITAIITNLSFNNLLWLSSCSSSLFQYAITAGRAVIPLFPTYCVVAEPLDVSFVACIEQYWPTALPPVLICHQVPLLECPVFIKSEMINL